MTPESQRAFENLRKLDQHPPSVYHKPKPELTKRQAARRAQSLAHRSMMGFMDGRMLSAIRHQNDVVNSMKKRGELKRDVPLYDQRYVLTVIPRMFK